jgi:hypothetical protein
MIIRSHTLRGISEGSITLAFRRWTRPTVKTGGSLMTALGKLQIRSVNPVDEAAISAQEAERAGYPSREELLEELDQRKAGTIYRIEFGGLAADPRVSLRETIPDDEEIARICEQLRQLDARAGIGEWTASTLEIINRKPGVLAEKLATELGWEKLPFKARVRKLKTLGLTISLERGYRISPRGEAVLAALTEEARK